MLGLPLAFTVPVALLGLIALPIIWVLIRITPPRPQRVPFPPIRILMALRPQDETPARTPPWLLALRLLFERVSRRRLFACDGIIAPCLLSSCFRAGV